MGGQTELNIARDHSLSVKGLRTLGPIRLLAKKSMTRSLFKPQQFNLLSLLGLMMIISLIAVRNSFWGTVFAIELIFSHAFITALVGNLPTTILDGMARNCRRLDGKIAPERVKEERKELSRLYWRVMIVVWVLFLLPANGLIWSLASGIYKIDGWFLPVGLIWVLGTTQLLRFIYFKLLEKLQLRSAGRHENYWIEDMSVPQEFPSDE